MIHIADRRGYKVPLDVVEFLEELATELGTSIRRIRLEEKLQESEERYHALLELETEVGEAMVILQDDKQGEAVHTFLNKQ